MKQKLLFIILLILANKSFSQDSRFSADLNFPIPFDHNFIADNYNGFIDLGIKYRFINSKKVNIGISINTGILKSNNGVNSTTEDFKITAYELQPKIFVALNFSKFHPFGGVGYTSMVFKSSTDNRRFVPIYYKDGFSLNNTQSGIDLNIGLKYNLNKKLFLQIQYDYIILGAEKPIINSKYNTNVNMIKIGTGIDF